MKALFFIIYFTFISKEVSFFDKRGELIFTQEMETTFIWCEYEVKIKDEWGETYTHSVDAIKGDSIFFKKHIFIPQKDKVILIYPNKKHSVFVK